MNRLSSPPIHETRILYEGPPHQGLAEVRRGGIFLDYQPDLPRECPFGVVAIIVPDG